MTSTTIQPCFNRVLLTLINPAEGSIEVPNEVHPEAQMIVVSVGPDVKCCKPGDSVMLLPGANILGLKSDAPGERIALIHDTSIVAILN